MPGVTIRHPDNTHYLFLFDGHEHFGRDAVTSKFPSQVGCRTLTSKEGKYKIQHVSSRI
jgi:hypothetical protein